MYEKFIARQPIFDEKLKVFAYELLFRSGPENFFKPQKEASSSVIVDSTMLFDLQTLTGYAKAFINLDLASLQRGAARLLPPSGVVIEILVESIVPIPGLVRLCKDLCAKGYELALEIHGIREAVELLGETEFRRWVSILAIVAMAADKPPELIRNRLDPRLFLRGHVPTRRHIPPKLRPLPDGPARGHRRHP